MLGLGKNIIPYVFELWRMKKHLLQQSGQRKLYQCYFSQVWTKATVQDAVPLTSGPTGLGAVVSLKPLTGYFPWPAWEPDSKSFSILTQYLLWRFPPISLVQKCIVKSHNSSPKQINREVTAQGLWTGSALSLHSCLTPSRGDCKELGHRVKTSRPNPYRLTRIHFIGIWQEIWESVIFISALQRYQCMMNTLRENSETPWREINSCHLQAITKLFKDKRDWTVRRRLINASFS